MNYYQLNRDKYLKKAKTRYHNGGGKEKPLNIMKILKKF